MTGPAPFRVLLVDDHPVARQVLREEIALEPGLQVVGEADDGEHALAVLARRRAAGSLLPDVVVMDLVMPGMGGVRATDRIVALEPEIRVVIHAGLHEDVTVARALEVGAAGYLIEEAHPEVVGAAILAAARGEAYEGVDAVVRPVSEPVRLDPFEAMGLTRQMTVPRVGLAALSRSDREILTLMASGLTDRDIACRLGREERAVRAQVSIVLATLKVHSRLEAVVLAIRGGLTAPPA